jgi:hypothetical protein
MVWPILQLQRKELCNTVCHFIFMFFAIQTCGNINIRRLVNNSQQNEVFNNASIFFRRGLACPFLTMVILSVTLGESEVVGALPGCAGAHPGKKGVMQVLAGLVPLAKQYDPDLK